MSAAHVRRGAPARPKRKDAPRVSKRTAASHARFSCAVVRDEEAGLESWEPGASGAGLLAFCAASTTMAENRQCDEMMLNATFTVLHRDSDQALWVVAVTRVLR